MPRSNNPPATIRFVASWPAPSMAASRSSSPMRTACCSSRCRLTLDSDRQIVATSAFVTRQLDVGEHLNGAAELLGMDHEKALAWVRRQSIWPADALLRLGCAVQAKLAAERLARQAQREVEKLSDNLASTYEEICLLHGVTQNLRINSDEEQLCAARAPVAARLPAGPAAWRSSCCPSPRKATSRTRPAPKACLLTAGQCPLDNRRLHAADRGPAPRGRLRAARRQPSW